MTSIFEQVQLKKLSREGVKLVYRYIQGERKEKAPLVFVHGWAGSAEDWRTLVERYTGQGESCLVYDAAGFGQSQFQSEAAAHAADYSLGRYVEDLKALLDAEGIEQARLVGHSWGGVVAMCFAARYPERVVALVPIGSAYFDPEKLLHQILKWASYLIALVLIWSKPLLRRSRFLRRVGVRRYFNRSLPPEVTEPIMLDVLQSHNRAIIQTLLTGYEVRFKEICPAIACPTLYVGSDHDVAAPLTYVIAFVPLTPRASSAILKDCGHFPMLEKLDELVVVLDNFFENSFFTAKDAESAEGTQRI